MSADYCELCDLPKSQCIHGQPPPAPVVKAAPAPRTRSTTSRSSTTSRATPGTSRPVNRRWTPPDALKPAILTVLQDAGGELPSDDVFEALEELVRDELRPGDHEKTPEGELRWHFAARRARQQLIGEGLLVSVPGVWKLA